MCATKDRRARTDAEHGGAKVCARARGGATRTAARRHDHDEASEDSKPSKRPRAISKSPRHSVVAESTARDSSFRPDARRSVIGWDARQLRISSAPVRMTASASRIAHRIMTMRAPPRLSRPPRRRPSRRRAGPRGPARARFVRASARPAAPPRPPAFFPRASLRPALSPGIVPSLAPRTPPAAPPPGDRRRRRRGRPRRDPWRFHQAPRRHDVPKPSLRVAAALAAAGCVESSYLAFEKIVGGDAACPLRMPDCVTSGYPSSSACPSAHGAASYGLVAALAWWGYR